MGSMTAFDEERRELWEALKTEAGRRPEEQAAIEYLLAHLIRETSPSDRSPRTGPCWPECAKSVPQTGDPNGEPRLNAASHLGHRC